MTAPTLDAFLNSYVRGQHARHEAVAATIRKLAEAAVKVRHTISQGALGAAFAGTRGANATGDDQKDLDVFADDIFLDAMRHAPVAFYASEELEQPVLLDSSAALAVAIDPLDGSSSIDVNMSIGTIFSLLPATGAPDADPAASFLQAGTNMLGAGFFIYGPQLALVLSLGSGTMSSCSRSGSAPSSRRMRAGCCRRALRNSRSSNYRHWDEAVRLYVDDCLKGSEGPRDGFQHALARLSGGQCYRI